jgi:SAM-dependent methyltransferase
MPAAPANAAGRLRGAAAWLRYTAFHPQWFIFRSERDNLRAIGAQMRGRVLDVGCADQKPRWVAPAGSRYIGLDYYRTATEWYGTRPDVFGDAQQLPVRDRSVDTVLLLDVLEHLPEPEACLREIHRALAPDGQLIVQVPFMYPIHDAPLDFRRWTVHGLRHLAERHGFKLAEEVVFGSSLETAALLANLAMAKTVLDWIRARHPLAVLALVVPVAVLLANLMARLVSWGSRAEAFMANGYRMRWVKATEGVARV